MADTGPADAVCDVLVVDDNPATRYATSRVLRAAGYRTHEAGTGREALARVDATTSAVVLDVHLPDMDGFEVCRELRSRPDTVRVPVIHLSAAYVRDADKVRGLHAGADAYMTHPAEPDLLVATLQALVRARTAEDAMRRSEARFKAIYDQAFSAICLIDAEGRIVEANPAMLALLKRPAQDVLARPAVSLVPAEWQERVGQCLADSRVSPWRGEFPLLDADGQLIHMAWSISPHLEQDLQLAIGIDMSQQVALSRQREELLEREQAARAAAEQASRAKDEFIAVLSHELRTPLNAILNWAHVLTRSDAPAMRAKGVEAIERNARLQTRLISDILDVSRIDLGKLRLEPELAEPVELVRSSVTALASAFQDKGIALAMRLPVDDVPMLLDPARFQQIVWNLLTNAIKFSPQGGKVELALAFRDQAMHLTVRDEGQGIKPDFLPYLFERFTQSDTATKRHHGGLGLGLSIVKHLVELHGGQIFAESPGLGLGASFNVVIPVRDAQDGAASVDGMDASVHDASDVSGQLSGITVLIVEDDMGAREVLGLILKERGAQVAVAGDFASGLAALEAALPDVLVSDIGMPGKDGYALIHAVRERELGLKAPRIPAIALTAFAREQDREHALKAGFDAYLTKPLRPNELVSEIRGLVGAGKG